MLMQSARKKKQHQQKKRPLAEAAVPSPAASFQHTVSFSTDHNGDDSDDSDT
jgi:hypothetical protein